MPLRKPVCRTLPRTWRSRLAWPTTGRNPSTQTDPLCRRWVNNVAINGKSCREALDQILKPVGLRYQVEKGSIVLSRLPCPRTSPGEDKLEAARAALRSVPKDTARAQKLLLEILEKDKATLQPGSLCYVYVYLGYIADRSTNREQAVAWFKQGPGGSGGGHGSGIAPKAG